MTSAQEGAARDPGVESSLNVISKSSVWQGFLSAASVLATSMLLEIVSNLLESWVGQNHVLTSLSYWLSRFAVLIVVLAAAYVLWRKLSSVRERVRAERELRLTADLVPPGPAVRSWAGSAAAQPISPPEPNPALNGDITAAVLRDLPFDSYETAALYDMVTAILAAPLRLPLAHQPQDGNSATTVVADLIAKRALRQGERDRLVRISVPLTPTPEQVRDSLEWEAALPALLRYHADHAMRWAAALDSPRLAAGARRWFEQEEDQLRTVLRQCGGHATGSVLPVAVPELMRIADALDLWCARNGCDEANRDVLKRVSGLADRARFPLEHELAQIRIGRPVEDSRITWLHPYKAALAARADQRRALDVLDGAEPEPVALREAARLLERAWQRLPRKDIAGEVSALIDLAAVHLREGRLDAARNRLAVAEVLAESGRDRSGAAHTQETLGVLWWARGERRRALRCWQRALMRYRELDHRLGAARCLQHMGSAMVVAPEYGSLLLSDEPVVGEVLRQATGWLAESEALRHHDTQESCGPDCLANRYRQDAITTLHTQPGLFDPATGPPNDPVLDGVDRWPLHVPDDPRHG
ncbi:tetratricopeptide repeat protein [Nocardia transvalensis]|uniref:tetratricopeptide repeat protein n=1 Tax=Nocardia transvalensis TaxID=37333 RepID=UPI001894FDEB|nr:tetratricopeptide repeat protein [Nocardia transvalensis]MBF6331247.1 tetratricopeptide repeat protein [Nocardia transvalensis]